MLELYTYNAGKGDCIRIHYGNTNILVDSGVTRFGSRFQKICDDIHQAGEAVDCLIITHSDSDHLGGALYAARDKKALYINEVWMNGAEPRTKSTSQGSDVQLSVRQNTELMERLRSRGIKIVNVYRTDHFQINGAEIDILWPTKEVAENVSKDHSKVDLGYHNDYRQRLRSLADKRIERSDKSPSNHTSIVFTFQYDGKQILFTGDAWGSDVISSLPTCKAFDLVKLPHHGSIASITEEWDQIVCRNYMICTDGKDHPDKQTIAKLLKWNGEINIISPSNWWEHGFFIPEDVDYKGRLHFHQVDGSAVIL